jgi:pimeloyl-ACP methyl ester carboxylesterase
MITSGPDGSDPDSSRFPKMLQSQRYLLAPKPAGYARLVVRCSWLAMFVLTALINLDCQARTTSPMAGALFRYTKVLELALHERITSEAGQLFVPENRSRHRGPVISIPFYRLRSTASGPASPIFVVAGGPGESHIESLDGPDRSRGIADLVQFFQRTADVVLFDQRGAGRAAPKLECVQSTEMPLGLTVDPSRFLEVMREAARACRIFWTKGGVDLPAYNSVESAADISDLARALGYKKISLLGASYGSHLSLVTMREFPELVERAVLMGLEGPDHTYDLPSQVLAALKEIAAAAEQSETLGGYVPEGGLLKAFQTVADRLAADPVDVALNRDGERVVVKIGERDIQAVWKHGATQRENLTWPANVIAMYNGDLDLPAKTAIGIRTGSAPNAMAMMMDCASGISRKRLKRIQEADPELAAKSIIGDINEVYLATCDIWQPADLGDSFRKDVTSEIPVLLFHGTWDLSTPYHNVREVLRGLANAVLVTVERGTHSVGGDLLREWPPMRRLLSDFLQGKDIDPPRTITLPPPKFVPPE